MMFWFLLVLMVIAAMGLVCLPMLRPIVSSRGELESEQTLYQARILEIEKDLELGRLDSVSAEAAKAEEARRLIKASEKDNSKLATSANNKFIMLAAIFLPLFSIPVYYGTGTPNVDVAKQVIQQTATQSSITDLLEVAEKRLSQTPDDTDGWKAIAPVYVRLGRFNDAENAYQNILRVEGRTPEFIIKLADVYIEEKQGQIDERAKALINEVLAGDKNHPIARFYSGIVELQKGNQAETLRIWQDMVDTANGDENWLPIIKGRIAELQNPAETPVVPPLDEETLKAAQSLSPEERSAMIAQMVLNLSQKLDEQPDNKEGWERLIRSYIMLEKPDNARDAFIKASDQFKNDQTFVSFLEDILLSNNITTKAGD